MLPRPGDQGAAQLVEAALGGLDSVAQVEEQVGRHLVVAAAAGVEPPRRLADLLGEPGLDIHVHVLERRVEREASVFDLLFDVLEPLEQRGLVLGPDQLAGPEHPRVSAGEAQVVARQRPVEMDRCREAFYRGVGRRLEPASPELPGSGGHGANLGKKRDFRKGED